MKYSNEEYEGFDPCEGDYDEGVRCRKVKMARVRKNQLCHISLLDDEPHDIEKGQMARYEKALVDDTWSAHYCCVPCMDSFLDEINGEGEDDE